MKRVIFHRLAWNEFVRAIRYWNRVRHGLGDELQIEIERAILEIRQDPKLGGPFGESGARFWIEKRFHYVIYYREFEDSIWVMAVAHGHRRPNYWRHRRIG